jgi:hypothetical protein
MLTELCRLLQIIWQRVKWENDFKKPFWRLVLNGFANNAGMGNASKPCHCGVAPVDRLHMFWECPVAVAVRDAITVELGSAASLDRVNLWMMRPPPGMHRGVWMIVCLAAVAAIHKGCRLLWGWATREAQGGPPSAGAAAAGRRAVSYLWEFLTDFASMPGVVRLMVRTDDVPANHPFLALADDGGFVIHRRTDEAGATD